MPGACGSAADGAAMRYREPVTEKCERCDGSGCEPSNPSDDGKYESHDGACADCRGRGKTHALHCLCDSCDPQ